MPEAELNVFEGLEFYFQPLSSKLQIVDVHVGADLVTFALFESTEQVASFELEAANLVQYISNLDYMHHLLWPCLPYLHLLCLPCRPWLLQ